jgi:anthranilate 3-monooxygenase (FAD) / 4-hydroxyphenylacetate 3-monooxygenase
VRSAIIRSEIEYETSSRGSIRPGLRPLQTARNLLPKAYPKAIETLQKIGAGGLLMLPSAADFDSEIRPLVDKYYGAAGGLSGIERSRLFKLAWDLCGDGFGLRSLQYERYYAGDPARMTVASFLSYDKSDCERLVSAALDLSRTSLPQSASTPESKDAA